MSVLYHNFIARARGIHKKTGGRNLCRRRIYVGYNPFGMCRIEAGCSNFKRQSNKTSLSHNMVEQHFCPRSHQNMGLSSDFVKIGLWSVIRCGRVGRGCSNGSKKRKRFGCDTSNPTGGSAPGYRFFTVHGTHPFLLFFQAFRSACYLLDLSLVDFIVPRHCGDVNSFFEKSAKVLTKITKRNKKQAKNKGRDTVAGGGKMRRNQTKQAVKWACQNLDKNIGENRQKTAGIFSPKPLAIFGETRYNRRKWGKVHRKPIFVVESGGFQRFPPSFPPSPKRRAKTSADRVERPTRIYTIT